jgi:hypothetical protein
MFDFYAIKKIGLSALRLSECLDIMANEYPDKYTELTSYLAEKRRKSIAAKQLAKQDAQIASAPKPGRPVNFFIYDSLNNINTI